MKLFTFVNSFITSQIIIISKTCIQDYTFEIKNIILPQSESSLLWITKDLSAAQYVTGEAHRCIMILQWLCRGFQPCCKVTTDILILCNVCICLCVQLITVNKCLLLICRQRTLLWSVPTHLKTSSCDPEGQFLPDMTNRMRQINSEIGYQ